MQLLELIEINTIHFLQTGYSNDALLSWTPGHVDPWALVLPNGELHDGATLHVAHTAQQHRCATTVRQQGWASKEVTQWLLRQAD